MNILFFGRTSFVAVKYIPILNRSVNVHVSALFFNSLASQAPFRIWKLS